MGSVGNFRQNLRFPDVFAGDLRKSLQNIRMRSDEFCDIMAKDGKTFNATQILDVATLCRAAPLPVGVVRCRKTRHALAGDAGSVCDLAVGNDAAADAGGDG